MSRHRKFAMLMLLSVASATFAMAQTTQPSGTETPHQKQAMHDQMMKDCMKKEHDKDASLSKDQLKKNCQAELKMKDHPTG